MLTQGNIMIPSNKIHLVIEKELHAHYGFKKIIWCSKLDGFSSANYKILADSTPCVLKLAPLNRLPHIQQLIDAATFLSQKDIPVSVPLATTTHEYFFVFKTYICLVLPFVEGDILHEAHFDPQTLSSAAHFLAQFHKAASSYTPHLPPSRKFIKSKTAIKKEAHTIIASINEKPSQDDTEVQLIKNIHLKLQVLEKTSSSKVFLLKTPFYQPVHGDFHNENIIFNHKKAIHLLDLEEIRLGSRTEDVFHFIFLACCNSGFSPTNLEKARVFFQSYNSQYPFVEADLHTLLQFELYKIISTFFLETQNPLLSRNTQLKLLVRDHKKISYLSENLTLFLDELSRH